MTLQMVWKGICEGTISADRLKGKKLKVDVPNIVTFKRLDVKPSFWQLGQIVTVFSLDRCMVLDHNAEIPLRKVTTLTVVDDQGYTCAYDNVDGFAFEKTRKLVPFRSKFKKIPNFTFSET